MFRSKSLKKCVGVLASSLLLQAGAPVATSMSESATNPSQVRHVENRRLFNAAAGRARLEEWEYAHLRGCDVCGGVLCVIVNQTTGGSPDDDDSPAERKRDSAQPKDTERKRDSAA